MSIVNDKVRFWVVITFLSVLLGFILLFQGHNQVLKEPADRVSDKPSVTVYHITGHMGAVGDIDIYVAPEGGK